MSEQIPICECHDCTQARYRGSLQGQIDQAMRNYHPPQEYPLDPIMNRRMAEYSDWVHTNLQNLFDKKPLEPRLPWNKPGRKVFTCADVVKK